MLREPQGDHDLQREAGGEQLSRLGQEQRFVFSRASPLGRREAALVPCGRQGSRGGGSVPGADVSVCPGPEGPRPARRSLGVTPCGRRAQCGPGRAVGPAGRGTVWNAAGPLIASPSLRKQSQNQQKQTNPHLAQRRSASADTAHPLRAPLTALSPGTHRRPGLRGCSLVKVEMPTSR